MNDNQNLSLEYLIPRLGDLLVNDYLITPGQLEYALKKQAEYSANGQQMLLGQVLVKLGLVEQEMMDEMITRQIFQLKSSLEQSNHTLERRVEQRTAELRQALAKLNELNQLKSEFIANVSHELRTPLHIILGYLELFATDSQTNFTEIQFKALESMQNNGQRLKHLVENMLTFANVQSSSLPISLVPTMITEPVLTSLKRVRPMAESRQIGLNTRIHPEIPLVRADKEKITWVVGQLLDNAVKFTPEGGRVELKTDAYQDNVTVAVKDTGIGIPPDRIDEIFEPFHQLDGSSKRRYSGTGLGLALVRNIIEAHGSTISVQSQVGQGSCFEFSLPAAC